MQYTIKQLADLTGISTRALRYYDEIDLFKPAIIAQNQYRYYEKSQLVDLQQILFFKALGLSLDDIKKMLISDDYAQIDTLISNRNKLTEKIKHLQNLIENCQATIQHCRGKIIMRDKELFSGFDAEKQQVYEDFLIARGVSQETIDDSWKKVTNHTIQEREELHKQCNEITAKLAECLKKQMPVQGAEVQQLIAQHYKWVCEYWTPNKETYKGLASMYGENNEFSTFYQGYHKDMVSFLQQAMTYYADTKLK
ncbi:MerR family transcriptional regulator [Legionella parisiensis]|uniref:HTH-type transcriptional activator mta n=1 Tax=Legionella parisiensis TaxID=45071 RepID=A0A1E5JWJ4_9GAMM|nr:MerR family transcriptional regulator [Legionella parisiensis]KTD42229.1 mercury resistance transcriptional regulator SkgA [Legionella parisiensis]OEH48899.1 HTH-type transcriptional activator mta [Legionella parisiensis]STX72296.1 transcriptional regulator SkgA, mercury resistanc [Legionella parisiensis]